MKKGFALLSLLIAVLMVFTACGSAGGNSPTSTAEATAPAATAQAASTAPEKTEPPAELTAAYITFGGEPKDLQMVNDELSKLTLEKINVKIKLMPINIGQYNQQINLMLSSNEALDTFVVFYDMRAGFISKGAAIELDDLLAQYGQGIKTAIGEDALMGGKINGKLYTLPTSPVSASEYSLIYNKDMADQNGIDLSGVDSIDDLTAVFKQVKEKIRDIEVISPQMVGFSILGGYSQFDYLGDYYGVLPNYGTDSLNLVNYYETQEYADSVKLIRSWNQAGYIMKGASTNKEATDDLMKAKKVFARFGPDAPQEMENCTSKYGFNTAAAHITPKTRGGLVVNQWAIAQNCENPEAAMKFLNLLYTDSDVANMASYGLEGKHYQKLADGTIDYAPGVDMSTTGFTNQSSWMLTYQPVTYVWKGSPQWQVRMDYNKDGMLSKAYGFTFDTTTVKTEITSLANVVNQYKLPLECGEVDPDTTLPKFTAKLKEAGIEKVIAEKQKQLNEWAAANGIK